MTFTQQWSRWMNYGFASIPQVLLRHYKDLGLNEQELMLLIHIQSLLNEGHAFPSIEDLNELMTCSPLELSRMLNNLRKLNYLSIESSEDQEGKVVESFSLEPLWNKLLDFLNSREPFSEHFKAHPNFRNHAEVATSIDTHASWPETTKINQESDKNLEGEVFKRFEMEFGRSLSPMECETITLWLDEDHHEPKIIFMALKEAVISNKLSLRYIDRILFEWQKNGFKTVEDIKNHSKKFRQKNNAKQPAKSDTTNFKFYNWLED